MQKTKRQKSISTSVLQATRYTFRAQRGFTIVELLVSITIFSLITSFAVTVFIRSLRAQRSVVALISANDNVSLAIEAIARELRRGRDFSGNGFALSDSPELRFFNAEQKEVIYRYDSSLQAITRSENGGVFSRVTAPNIVVEGAHFAIQGSSLPRITISIKLGSKDRDIADVVTEIHTTVSSRGLNNPPPSN